MQEGTRTKGSDPSLSSLKGIPESLLYPLISRYVESKASDGLFKDPKSVEILDVLDRDMSKSKLYVISRLGICCRTLIFDEQVQAFLSSHPEGLIINLGCGLDTRFSRIDNGQLHWVDLDLPEVIAIKRRFFEESDRYRLTAKSVLDPSWADKIPKGKKTLIIMEGLFYYLSKEENQGLLKTIKKHFPGSHLLIECLHPLFIRSAKKQAYKNPLDENISSMLKFSVKSGREIAAWDDDLRFIEEWSVINRARYRFPLRFRLLFALLPILTRSNKVTHLCYR